jgi:general secretion pathway protein G
MERSTVTGKEMRRNLIGNRHEGESESRSSRRCGFNLPWALSRSQRGFTLLELMIVMFIMTILVTVALPQYQRSVLHAKESVLHDNLFKFRTLIDQYAADKGKLPQSLNDLVTANYIREKIPKDPITDEETWNVIMGEDPNLKEGEQGVIDVRSLSEDISTEGNPYSQW